MSLFAPKSGSFFSFKNVGDSISGVVTAPPTQRQATDFMTKKPATLQNGQPRMEILINLQDDAGVEWTIGTTWRMERAITDAIVASGVTDYDLKVGDRLTVTFSGHEQGKGSTPAKTFSVEYFPAGQGALAQQPQAQQAPAAPAAPQGYAQPQPTQYQQPVMDQGSAYGQVPQGGYGQPAQQSAPAYGQPVQQGAPAYGQPVDPNAAYGQAPEFTANPWQ